MNNSQVLDQLYKEQKQCLKEIERCKHEIAVAETRKDCYVDRLGMIKMLIDIAEDEQTKES